MSNNLLKRQLSLPGFTQNHQTLLKESSVAIVGCGGLGCSASLYLSGAGIGKIIFIDGDKVDTTNLHRQIAYSTFNIGNSKVECLANRCLQTNTNLNYDIYNTFIDETNISILNKANIILDCSDNSTTRILLNNYCMENKKPLIFGSSISYDGQLCVFDFRKSNKCLFCVFPDIEKVKDTCNGLGVLGPVPGIIGSLQAIECIKLITGIGEVIKGVLHYSSFDTSFMEYFVEEKNCSIPIKDERFEINYEEYIKSKTKYTLIDIRPSFSSWEDEESILGSIKVPTPTEEDIIKLNKKNILLICSIGENSLDIVKRLRAKGIHDCWSIKNGFRGI